jgi:hypothetical protein
MELLAAALTDLKAAMTIDQLPSGITCIMPEDYPLSSVKNLARAVAAFALDLAVAEVTDDTPLGGDDLDLVLVELSLSGVELIVTASRHRDVR